MRRRVLLTIVLCVATASLLIASTAISSKTEESVLDEKPIFRDFDDQVDDYSPFEAHDDDYGAGYSSSVIPDQEEQQQSPLSSFSSWLSPSSWHHWTKRYWHTSTHHRLRFGGFSTPERILSNGISHAIARKFLHHSSWTKNWDYRLHCGKKCERDPMYPVEKRIAAKLLFAWDRNAISTIGESEKLPNPPFHHPAPSPFPPAEDDERNENNNNSDEKEKKREEKPKTQHQHHHHHRANVVVKVIETETVATTTAATTATKKTTKAKRTRTTTAATTTAVTTTTAATTTAATTTEATTTGPTTTEATTTPMTTTEAETTTTEEEEETTTAASPQQEEKEKEEAEPVVAAVSSFVKNEEAKIEDAMEDKSSTTTTEKEGQIPGEHFISIEPEGEEDFKNADIGKRKKWDTFWENF